MTRVPRCRGLQRIGLQRRRREGSKQEARGCDVEELLQCPFDVAGHGHVNGAMDIVPVKGETTVESTCPINCDGGDKMVGVGRGTILYAGVVDDEAESERARSVVEKTRGVDGRSVAVGDKVLLEADICQNPCM